MKILVTGNEGMIGSVVEKVLCADGDEVVGFDIVSGHNILNPNQIRSALVGCDAVVHLAALIGSSSDAPDEIMQVIFLVLGTFSGRQQRQNSNESFSLVVLMPWESSKVRGNRIIFRWTTIILVIPRLLTLFPNG